jgi:hypothetical protein
LERIFGQRDVEWIEYLLSQIPFEYIFQNLALNGLQSAEIQIFTLPIATRVLNANGLFIGLSLKLYTWMRSMLDSEERRTQPTKVF